LATNWQNFTEIIMYLTKVKILQKVLEGYFVDSHTMNLAVLEIIK